MACILAATHLVFFRRCCSHGAYLLTGDMTNVGDSMQSANRQIMASKQSFSKPLADRLRGSLYEAAKQQGDFRNALSYHEKYAEASKGLI